MLYGRGFISSSQEREEQPEIDENGRKDSEVKRPSW
jgi:hypothetical protein